MPGYADATLFSDGFVYKDEAIDTGQIIGHGLIFGIVLVFLGCRGFGTFFWWLYVRSENFVWLFFMTFSIFSQTAVHKCPFPKELLDCRLVIVIVTQPGIDRNSLYKKSKMVIFNKRFILHGKNFKYCLISRQSTYFVL